MAQQGGGGGGRDRHHHGRQRPPRASGNSGNKIRMSGAGVVTGNKSKVCFARGGLVTGNKAIANTVHLSKGAGLLKAFIGFK